ncbi:MAG: GDP-mannose 4,6-dehydratase, partial [Candidatus Aminicenantales bacterium]
VRDVVRAYFLLMQKGRRGQVYNVSSGKAVNLQHILETLLSFSRERIAVKEDPKKLRKVDIPLLLGDNRKIKSEAGWQPHIPLRESLRDLLDDWRHKIKNNGVRLS